MPAVLQRSPRSIKRALAFAIALLLLLPFPVSASENGSSEASEQDASESDAVQIAVDPIHQGDSYCAVLYDNTSGLPTSEANAIAETSDGFIWIGGYAGLMRYDGNYFERMDSTEGIASVVCLHVDSQDRLWIGTNDNGLAVMERGEFRMWHEEDGLGSSKINTITEDGSGTIYVGTTTGIVMIGPDMELKKTDDPALEGLYVEVLRPDSDGLIYGITYDDDIFFLKDGRAVNYIPHETYSIGNIVCVYPDPDDPGNMYLATEDSGFYYFDQNNTGSITKAADISPLADVKDIEQFGDQIWLCARNGIGILEDGEFYYLDNLPMMHSIGHVMADYEGNLWFTSTRVGVMKLVPNKFQDVFKRYGLEPDVINSTCLYGGRIFIGTDTGLIVLDGRGVISSLPLAKAKSASGEDLDCQDLIELLNGNRIRSIIRDNWGRLWISTWRGRGLLRYDGSSVTVFSSEDGLITDQIRAVCEREDGSVLVAHSGGVCVIEGNEITRRWTEEDGIVNPEILTVSYASNGDIIAGSNGGGIYILGDRQTRIIGKEDGLSSGIVMRIKRDPVRDVYWIVSSNSIAYMTPNYHVTTVKNFPYSNNFDMYINSRGDAWILSSNGIYVVPVEDLLKNGEIKPIHYSLANGLPCITTSNSYSELTKNGNLYISGNTGVAKVNIESPLENIYKLKVSVPFIDADGVRLYPDGSGSFTVPAKTRKLTIYCFVFNYSLTDPQLTYHLEGFDRESVTVKRSELFPIDYTNLPGGKYSFDIELMDSQGRGSKNVSVSIVKEKAIYEQTWFFVSSALGAALFLAGIISLIVRRKTKTLEKKHQEAVDKERLVTELKTANAIQGSMLPHDFPPFPDRTEFDIYAQMDPAREVGGDFYDFFLIDEDHLCLVIADVSGKGIPAALFMMISKVILQSCAMLGKSAAEILTKTNEALCSDNQVEMFVTVWLGILEISTGKITAANAGHEYPALMKDGRFSLLKDKHGFVIGGMDGLIYQEYEIVLEPGDKLFVYTDGVPEATDKENKMFGTERMVTALNKDPGAPPEDILKNVRDAVDAFVSGAEQFDDLTMLCIEYKGQGSGS